MKHAHGMHVQSAGASNGIPSLTVTVTSEQLTHVPLVDTWEIFFDICTAKVIYGFRNFLFQILRSFQMYICADFLVFLTVKQEDEPAEGGQGEAVPEKTEEETEEEKKIKKVMKLFKR